MHTVAVKLLLEHAWSTNPRFRGSNDLAKGTSCREAARAGYDFRISAGTCWPLRCTLRSGSAVLARSFSCRYHARNERRNVQFRAKRARGGNPKTPNFTVRAISSVG